MRDLVASEWYQRLWGARVTLVRTAETSFENTRRGARDGMPFSALTGGRGDQFDFRDAIFLWENGVWTPSELDNADALLVALVQRLKGAKRG